MRSLGPRSLASYLKLCIDVVYFLSFVPAVLLVVIAVALPFIGAGGHLTVHPQVLLRFNPDDLHILPGTSPNVPSVTIERAVAQLALEGVSAGRVAIGLAFAAILWTFLFVSLRKLRAIFRTLRTGDPFVPENAGRIRFLGFTVIVSELILRGATFWMYFAFVANQFGIAGMKLRPLFEFNGSVIFAGLALLIVAEVFRLGTDLRREQELTV